MNKGKQLTTIETTVKEEKSNKELVATGRYKPYKQNNLIDNTIKELINYKQLDLWGNAFSKQETRNSVFELTIENYIELEEYLSKELFINQKANQSAGKLLDCLMIKSAEEGFRSPLVILPLREYGEQIDKTDMKELRKKVRADLAVLKRVKISDSPKRRKNGEFINVYLFGGIEGIKNGKIIFKFNIDFFNIFAMQQSFLYMPIEALQSSERTNPHTYLLYKKIISHKRINVGKPRENIIKVRELYDYCITLPRYETIKSKGGQVDQRIITPFERDLDIIKEFSWEYDGGGIDKTNFQQWLEKDIIIYWNNEQPDTATIIKGREKHQKKLEKAKQKALEKQEIDKLKQKEEQQGN